MKKLNYYSAALFMLFLLFAACDKKGKISPDPPFDTYNSLEELFDKMETKYLNIEIDAATTSSFYGASGTRYTIYGQSLETEDGQPVTGQVDIQVAEYLERGDMIFSKMLPISQGEPLITGGQIDIRITQNGKPLRLKNGYQFTANVPQRLPADTAMRLYHGTPVANDVQNKVDWGVAVVSPNIEINRLVVGKDTISIFSDSLTFCNIDRVMPDVPKVKTTISFTVDGSNMSITEGVYAYALYSNFNAVMPLYIIDNVSAARELRAVQTQLVVFTVIDKKFYGGVTDVLPVSGGSYTISLKATDPKTFKQMLNGL